MGFVDYGVSEDCINIWSFGEICVHCGCCSNNPNYRDMILKRIRYYKEWLEEKEEFEFSENEKLSKIQKENIEADIRFNKRMIRMYKKILWTLRKEQP